jgi:hypothetical protein
MSYTKVTVTTERQPNLHRIRHNGCSAIDRLLMPVEFLLGCWHRNLSRPFTLSGWTYEVCLNCGKQFPYNRAEIYSRTSQQKGSCSLVGVPVQQPAKSSPAIYLAIRSGTGSLVGAIKSTARDVLSLCRKQSPALASMNVFLCALEIARRGLS